MPGSHFFRNLGLFVCSDFWDTDSCARIQAEMVGAGSHKAQVFGATPNESLLDETRRKVLVCTHLAKSTRASVRDKLWALKPELESHFGVSLMEMESPGFLRYGQGAFYRPHQDTHRNDPPDTPRRRVSIVTFLNPTSKAPQPNCYGGGSLTFYGLLAGPEWEKCAFSLEAEPGLLIAFRPDTFHEVQEVTFGERFTIVTWFLA